MHELLAQKKATLIEALTTELHARLELETKIEVFEKKSRWNRG